MNVLQEIRRKNMVSLAQRHGGQSALAKALGRSKEQINALCKSKPMGDVLAKSIEDALDLPSSWMDTSHDTAIHAHPAATTSRLLDDAITIPRYDMTASMGDGHAADDHVDVVERIEVNRDYLRRAVRFSSPENLAIITALGDSMAPTFNDCDLLLVDRGVNEIKLDAVYVIHYEGQYFVKRIQRRPGEPLLMISDNQAYRPQEISRKAADFQVMGRVLMAWNARKL